jgi:hypothetical protein
MQLPYSYTCTCKATHGLNVNQKFLQKETKLLCIFNYIFKMEEITFIIDRYCTYKKKKKTYNN